MNISTKLLKAAAGQAVGAGLDVDDVFSTFLYDGNGATQVIENGIALGNSNDGGSVNFNGVAGATGDWVVMPSSADFGYGTGDFTIEFFVYFKTIGIVYTLYDQRTSSQDYTTASILIFVQTDGTIRFDTLSSAGGSTGRIEGSVSAGQWYHVALCRSGTSTKMFLNGTQAGSTFSDSTDYVTPASSWSIGGSEEQNQYSSNAYISNVRVVKGTALYTSNFTAPTSELTTVTNTKLLTLQGDTPFVDNSSSSHSITTNGSPIASDFGPFTGTSGEGGLVWTKTRSVGDNHRLTDTARGAGKGLDASNTYAEWTANPSAGSPSGVSSFNSNGFVSDLSHSFFNNEEVVTWTFRKAPKFFDVVTYSGNGVSGRTISHNLGSVPGMIIIKCTNQSENWLVYHRNSNANPEDYWLKLNGTNAASSASYWGNALPTSTEFTIGGNAGPINQTTGTYVAYLFAHNDGDGEFGPDSDQDIIKCGSYSGSSGDINVNLGFEPQWLLIKEVSSAGQAWHIVDTMRAFEAPPFHDNGSQWLEANTGNAETGSGQYQRVAVTSTGFFLTGNNYGWGRNGETYIYMAIRRGPLAAPTDATKVFGVNYTYTYDVNGATGGSSAQLVGYLGEPSDLNIQGYRSGSSYNASVYDRLRNNQYLITSSTSAESSVSGNFWDNMAGFREVASGQDTTMISWTWKRAPSYFDVVAWTGTGSNMNISHNLGVVPEMIWARPRSYADNWSVFHKDLTYNVRLNDNSAMGTGQVFGTLTSSVMPTASGSIHASGQTYIAYLFATVAGVSKVGSVAPTGSELTVDCGFTSGARFVLMKRTDSTGDWFVWDSVRGIVSGNDPWLALNSNSSETTNTDYIDPHSSGFALTSSFYGSGSNFIFYAIA